jgi:hypothetical protein
VPGHAWAPIMGWRVYRTDFIAHYILPLPYPDHLTRGTQVVLGSLAVGAFVYWRVMRTVPLSGPSLPP